MIEVGIIFVFASFIATLVRILSSPTTKVFVFAWVKVTDSRKQRYFADSSSDSSRNKQLNFSWPESYINCDYCYVIIVVIVGSVIVV